jgi:hypothetical protein
MLDLAFVPGMETYPLDVSAWPNGQYILGFFPKNAEPVMQKLVVGR